jgi:YlmC/YmxH family sporulation protein
MQCRIADLRCKEVIKVNDGTRYGFVNDVLIETSDGRLVAIVVPGPYRFWSFFGKGDDVVIPWESIKGSGKTLFWWIFAIGGPSRDSQTTRAGITVGRNKPHKSRKSGVLCGFVKMTLHKVI